MIPPGESEEAKQKREKEERNYQKLENFRTNRLVPLANRLLNQVSDIWDIYKQYIKPFEQMDDDYRKRRNAIYKDRTSGQDKWNNFWDSYESIRWAFIKGFAVAFAGAFLLALAPGWLVVGGNAKEVGSYMSMTPQEGGLQSQLDLALNPAWGNTTENVTKVVVPKGTTIYEGIAAPQNIYDSLGNVIGTLSGGGNQVYIPTVEEGWFQ